MIGGLRQVSAGNWMLFTHQHGFDYEVSITLDRDDDNRWRLPNGRAYYGAEKVIVEAHRLLNDLINCDNTMRQAVELSQDDN